MSKNLLMTILVVCLLTISACAEAPLSDGHEVDPETDVIIGLKEARNELIIYLSPGQSESITFFLRHYRQIKRDYIDKNKLRIVVREVPRLVFKLKDKDGKLNNYKDAQKHSTMLATKLRCAHHYRGNEAYTKTWHIIGVSVALAAVKNKAINWPYYNSSAIETVFYNMGKDAQITKEEYISCTRKPLQSKFNKRLEHYTDILTNTADVSMPPAAFLNGEMIDMTKDKDYNEIMLYLKEHLEEEYKHKPNPS